MKHVVEMRAAYRDCNNYVGKKERNLSFLCATPLTAEALTTLMPLIVVDGYNYFDSVKSIRLLTKAFGNAEYFVAREGSVCIYIKPSSNVWLNRKPMILDADEFSYDVEKQMFRAWWD